MLKSDLKGGPRAKPKARLDPASRVEQMALAQSGYKFIYGPEEKIPSIVVPNFPALGRRRRLPGHRLRR